MKGRKRFIIIPLIIIVAILGYVFYPRKNIQEILEAKEYSYLPVEAKNLIEKVYEESGEVVLTEMNKKDNVPYLNPQYVEYLSLSDKEKSEVEEVPDVYRLDYVEEEVVSGASLPTKYDLRNVSGKNFVTPIKNQDSLNLCWAFTTTEQAESLLLKQSNASYNSSSYVFSPRQLDYANSFDGILNYDNDFGVRSLTEGGNYFMAAILLANGVGLTSEAHMPFSLDTSVKPLSDVLNYDNSIYELNNSIMVPSLSNPTTAQLNSYVSKVKQYIVDYGGVYVATEASNGSCASTNSDGTKIIRVDNNCVQNNSHAMQAIGWDDNYSYSYCAGTYSHSSNTSSCNGTVVTGKGAWLLRNSWGSDDPYVYLAYDAIDYDVRFSTDISLMSERTWDNNYHSNFDNYYILSTSSESQYFQKNINTVEKVEKVKVYVYGEGGKYTLSILSNNERYKKIKTVSISTAGIYTIDLSDQNILITDSGFSVELLAASGNAAYFVKDSISVFTSNVDETPIIETEDIYKNYTGSNYQDMVYSRTKNIPSNSMITYTLKNESGTDYSQYLTVINNKVAKNDVHAKVTVLSTIPKGTYYLTTTYGEYSATSKMVLGNSTLSGSGTVNSPYLITNEDELRAMSNNLSAHYKLSNNITITGNWEPIGSKEHPFTGSFNGNGYSISNLVVTKDHENSGLFGYVEGNTSSTTSFKNLVIESPVVEGSGDTGALIGTLTAKGDVSNYPTSSITIDNIVIMGGHVNSYFGNGGALIGSIMSPINLQYGKHTYNINRIFNSSSVGGSQSSGLIGYVLGSTNGTYLPTINLTNIDDVGELNYKDVRNGGSTFFTGSHGSIVGYALNFSNINLDKYVSTSYFREYAFSDDGTFGTYSKYTTITKTNGYSILNTGLSTMKTSSNYWSGYSTYWTFKTINGSSRIPVLKNVDFPYTEFSSITLHIGDSVQLSDYLKNKNDSMVKFVVGSSSNSSVATVTSLKDSKTNLSYDATITAVSAGSATLSVTNNYDGYEGTVTITVIDDNATDITYYKNDGTNAYRTQSTSVGATINLMNNPYSRVGYTFKNWNSMSDGTGTSYSNMQSVTVVKDMKLYAQWRANQYTIVYESNGGTGTMRSTACEYDQEANLRANTFTRDGYIFTGWNTKSDGSGTSYNDEESVLNLMGQNGSTITLYAQWKNDGTEVGDYEITGYTVTDNYIDDIAPGNSLTNFKKHIHVTGGYTVEVDLKGKSSIATGSTTTIYNDGVKVITYTNIVRGDPSGDGTVNSADLLRIVKHLKGTNTLTGAYFEAADCNYDGKINSADLLKIVKYLKGTGTIQR